MKTLYLFILVIIISFGASAAVAPITGTLTVCTASTTALANTTPGGAWTSSSPGVATVSVTGLVSGLAAGTADITYTVGTEYAVSTVSVNPLPAPITGPTSFCGGSSGTATTVSSSTSGGTWSSSTPSVATFFSSTSGTIFGYSAGTATVSYTLGTGCYTTTAVTILAFPASILGGGAGCVGASGGFINSVPGGIWSSSDTSVLIINSSSGGFTNISAGTTTISYVLPGGCSKSLVRGVTGFPAPISGTPIVCTGYTTTLSDATPGGYWYTANAAIATVNASGVVSGISVGTTTITYMAGCPVTITVTVDGAPAITGTATLCTGYTTTLVNSLVGGTWSSSDLAVATVDGITGVVSGIMPGSATITYTYGCGFATKNVTVSAALPSITGSNNVCVGSAITLSNITPGGTWSSSDVTVGTITPTTGIISGLGAGMMTISYSTATCSPAIFAVTVNTTPAAITGSPYVCFGTAHLLSSATTGGIWSSSNTAVLTAGSTSGIVTGVTMGTSRVTYAFATGCIAVFTCTVTPLPSVITGPTTLCAGSNITLTNTSLGGTWSSAATTVSVGSSSGIVTGVSVGTAVVSYILPTGCFRTATETITASCSGTPAGGVVSATSTFIYPGIQDTLSLAGAASGCGISYQWQISPDNVIWSPISGATNANYTLSVVVTRYYRCAVTCGSGGLTGYSSSVLINMHHSILSHNVLTDTFCSVTHFRISAGGSSPSYTVNTRFGDGSANTTSLSGTGTPMANIYHSYSLPGTYSVKQVLLYSGVPVDSTGFTYEHHSCQTLPLKLYYDMNNNCSFDAGEFYNMLPVSVRVDSNGIPIDTMTSTSGLYYRAYGPLGTIYSFRVLPVSGGMGVSCPFSGILYDTLSTSVISYPTKYFAFSCSSMPSFDLAVNSTSRSGIHTQLTTITVSNNYCYSVSPVLTMSHSPKYNYAPTISPCNRTDLLPTSVSGNTLTWNLSPLAANTSRIVTVYIERPSSMGWLIPGDTVQSVISVSPTGGDVNPGNNTVIRNDTVKSSFDPNDIAVSPEGAVLPCTQLKYSVQFENDGNDTAHNIYVLDTLSSSLDLSTIQIISASAAMNVSIISAGGYNVAKFDFPNIKLLDSSYHNNCNGMFAFYIKVKPGLADGISIMNRVGIYFDDNPVVMTNSVINTTGINPIIGANALCFGDTIALSDATPGGIWNMISSLASLTTIPSGSMLISWTPGTATISYTVANACTSRTATKVVTIDAHPTVGPISGPDSVCVGSSITLTNPVSGGLWSNTTSSVAIVGVSGVVLGIAAGTTAISYGINNTCAAVATVKIVTVRPMVTPAVSMTVSPGDTVCDGSLVVFTPFPVFGGVSPTYLWKLNSVITSVGASYAYSPVNGDVVNCLLLSNANCRLEDTVAGSNTIMTVDSTFIPSVVLSTMPGVYIVPGDSSTFIANVTNGGPSPTYQWHVNNITIAGATNSTFTSAALVDNDTVKCEVLGSMPCGLLSFNYVVMHSSTGIISPDSEGGITLFPNPNKGVFSLKGNSILGNEDVIVEIRNMLGQLLFKDNLGPHNKYIDEQLSLNKILSSGVYTLSIKSGVEHRVFHFVVNK